MTKRSIILALAVVAIVSMGTIANAATIIGSSYKADIGPGGGPWPGNVWNDAGGDVTAPDGAAWAASELFDGIIATSGNSNVVGWWEGRDGAPTLTFDLGALYDVQTIDVWRRVGNGTVTDLTFSVSTDDISYSAPVAYTPATWTNNQATIDVSAFDNAQYVRMKLGPDAVSGGWLMLTEVAFDGVPEPATMSLLALGGLALLRRRRSRN